MFTETLDHLSIALGTVRSKRLWNVLFDVVQEVEDTFCRLDWRAYREWAYCTSVDLQVKLEPCDAWFEVDGDEEWTPDRLPREWAP